MKKSEVDCRLLDFCGQAREKRVGIAPSAHGGDLIKD